MIETVIFDVDGTLVDSSPLHVESWERAFRKFGKTVAREDLQRHMGKGGDQYMPEFLNEEEMRTLSHDLESYRTELYQKEYLPRVKAFPKVRELFLRIKADGKRIVLASSGKGAELEVYQKVAGIEGLVDGVTTSDDAEKSKPHPDIFEAALRELDGTAAGTALVVGDSPYDVEAAAKAGMRAVGVLCGGFSERALREAGAIAVYRDPADLLERYESSPIGNSADEPAAEG